MSRSNRLLECPNCEEPTLTVVGSDADENNIGIRRYQCAECRNKFTTLEAFFTDDEGDPDCFSQIALNQRLADREKYHRRVGVRKAMRPLKSTDQIRVTRSTGMVTISYKRNPRVRPIWPECKRGHPFDEENTLINKTSGAQQCRRCRRINQRNWHERNREKVRQTQKRYDDSHREIKRENDRIRRINAKEYLLAHPVLTLKSSRDSMGRFLPMAAREYV